MTPGGIEAAATAVLHGAYGPGAAFRDHQLDAITAVVERRGRTLLVQRTGWGKSVVYFVATRLLRERGAGPTVIVSPLLALMRDQVAAANRFGLRAVTINSANNDDWPATEAELAAGRVDVLLVSPERFNNDAFRDRVLPSLIGAVGLLVIDEAHCISDWGHDFRPDYRRLSRLITLLPPGVPVLATTATANDRVVSDIQEQFGTDVRILRGRLHRDSLELHAMRLPSKAQRLAWLAREIPYLPGTGIVYTLTVGDSQRVAEWLRSNGISALAYSGASEPEQRLDVERQLRDNAVKVVCATSALGMGFDKPDLGFVIHYQSPPSAIAYYQQVGRAGRALDRAVAILLSGTEDEDIWDYFLRTSLPLQADAEAVVRTLEADGDWLTVPQLEASVNAGRTRLTGLLKVLDVEGAVERQGMRYRRSIAPWTFDAARVDRVRQQRLDEQRAMRTYPLDPSCRMEFMLRQLDDQHAQECGRCDTCMGPRFTAHLDVQDVARADAFLRHGPATIEPRLQWPGGRRSGRVPPDQRVAPGRALSRLAGGGWGDEVIACKHDGRPFPEAMIDALAEMVAREWRPSPPPTWIAYVPSRDPHRQFVRDAAEQLGTRLGLPVVDCLTKMRDTQPQKLMQNSSQQVANIDHAYRVTAQVPEGPALLFDDIVDSRWTVTLIGAELREAGVPAVFPVALARSRA